MKILKKPFVAVLLCIVIVLGSTGLSISAGLRGKCEKVIDGFYDGLVVNREALPSIAVELRELCGIAESMVTIAGNYGIATDTLSEQASDMKLTLNSHIDDVHYIYSEYNDLSVSIKTVTEALYAHGLSERHSDAMQDYSESIAAIIEAIAASGYNESVQSFLQRFDRFPSNLYAGMFNIQYPAYFG